MGAALQQFNFRALGGPNELQFYAEDKELAAKMAEQIINDIRSVESKYSRYLPDSLISKINANAGTEKRIVVDKETAALLDYAEVCYVQSSGLFDLTSGILRKVWNFTSNTLPSKAAIDEILPLICWEKVEWNNPYFYLPIKGMELDFGGIGKEYSVDRAVGFANQLGIQNGLINLGGDVRVMGPHLDGSDWKIGITHPRQAGAVLTSVQLSSGALATSGDYERFMEIDGVRYCHIINPKTGWPVQSFQSVSVLTESCLVAGSCCTIAMLLGEEAGKKFLQEMNFPSIVLCADGKMQVLDRK